MTYLQPSEKSVSAMVFTQVITGERLQVNGGSSQIA